MNSNRTYIVSHFSTLYEGPDVQIIIIVFDADFEVKHYFILLGLEFFGTCPVDNRFEIREVLL